MKTIHYVTGNKTKFANTQSLFEKESIPLLQIPLDMYEIQSLDSKEIALSKAKQA